MSQATENLQATLQRAMANRPAVGGFPYLAETLRRAGVKRNLWSLPAAQSLYIMEEGAVVSQGTPLVTGIYDVPRFNQEALVAALRTDQAGESTFPEFLQAAWQSGVVSYEVDFEAHTVTYFGYDGANYVESYPSMTED